MSQVGSTSPVDELVYEGVGDRQLPSGEDAYSDVYAAKLSDCEGDRRAILGECGTPLDVLAVPEATEDMLEVPEELVEYGTTRRRFLVAATFALFGFVNQMQYVAYATVVRAAERRFDVSALKMNLLSLLIPVMYCLGVLPGCWLYNKVGLRYGMIVGGTANALATFLKLVAVWVPKYPILCVAQLCVAVGQVLFLSLPPLVAGRWFPANERTVATAVCTLLGFFGMSVGMLYSPHTVRLPDKNGSHDWAVLVAPQLSIASLVLFLMVFFVPEKPEKQPSATASTRQQTSAVLWAKIRQQVRKGNLLLLAAAFGSTVGSMTSMAALLPQMLEPYGVPITTSGIMAASGIMGGAVNCAVVGFMVDRFHRYKRTLLILMGLTTVFSIIATICVATLAAGNGFTVAMCVLVPLIEVVVLPMVPVTMELSVELTYPDPETVSSTLVLITMCFFSFASMMTFSLILGSKPTRSSTCTIAYITTSICLVSLTGLCFLREERHRYERDHAPKPLAECEPVSHEMEVEQQREEAKAQGNTPTE